MPIYTSITVSVNLVDEKIYDKNIYGLEQNWGDGAQILTY
jgi:hypothetical protein